MRRVIISWINIERVRGFFFFSTSSDVYPRLWLTPLGLVTVFWVLTWILPVHVTADFSAICFSHSVDVSNSSCSWSLNLGETYSTDMKWGLNGTLIRRLIKKSLMIYFIYQNNAKTSMLIDRLNKMDSRLIFLHFQKRVVILETLSFLNALSHKCGIGLKL